MTSPDPLYILHQDDRDRGPFTIAQLRSLWHRGDLTVETLYRPVGFADWKRLVELASELERP